MLHSKQKNVSQGAVLTYRKHKDAEDVIYIARIRIAGDRTPRLKDSCNYFWK